MEFLNPNLIYNSRFPLFPLSLPPSYLSPASHRVTPSQTLIHGCRRWDKVLPAGWANSPGSRATASRATGRKRRNMNHPPPPSRVGRRQKRQKGSEAAARLPAVAPLSKCRLRLLKLERVKDYLLMEEEFVASQERLHPSEDKTEEDRSKVDDLRGTPMSVGSLEEIIDESHAIVSSSVGPEYYVGILSFVDKDQLEPGCAILMHNKVYMKSSH